MNKKILVIDEFYQSLKIKNPLLPKLFLVDDGRQFVVIWNDEKTLLDKLRNDLCLELFTENHLIKELNEKEAEEWYFSFDNWDTKLNGKEALYYVYKEIGFMTEPIIS